MPSTTTRTKRKRTKTTAKKAPQRVSNAKLVKLARKQRPPQSWFDQTDVPFVPTKE